MADEFRVLVHASEPVTPPNLTGPVVRALALARALGERHPTWLAAPQGSVGSLPGEPFELRVMTRDELVSEAGRFDLVVSQGMYLPGRALLRRHARWVFDLYDPVVFEAAAGGAPECELRHLRRFTNLLLTRADLVTCASPQQRDLWTGTRMALGCSGDAESVQVVPFGHDGSPPPERRTAAMRGAIEGIGESDKILFWGGGVWDWFDPLTLVEAVARLDEERGDVRLVFLAGPRPTGSAHEGAMLKRVRELARGMSVLGRSVFFHETWVPYEERGTWLAESDVAVCTAPDSLENRYSFRTRLTDAVWAGLPVVCTRGGFMGDFVEKHGIGLTVRPGDVEDCCAALRRVLSDDQSEAFRSRLSACRSALSWDSCVQPLVDFADAAARRGARSVPMGPVWRRYGAMKLASLWERIVG